jgi:hypothetical protein
MNGYRLLVLLLFRQQRRAVLRIGGGGGVKCPRKKLMVNQSAGEATSKSAEPRRRPHPHSGIAFFFPSTLPFYLFCNFSSRKPQRWVWIWDWNAVDRLGLGLSSPSLPLPLRIITLRQLKARFFSRQGQTTPDLIGTANYLFRLVFSIKRYVQQLYHTQKS